MPRNGERTFLTPFLHRLEGRETYGKGEHEVAEVARRTDQGDLEQRRCTVYTYSSLVFCEKTRMYCTPRANQEEGIGKRNAAA